MTLSPALSAAPKITISPAVFGFGNVNVGDVSAPQVFVIENTGTNGTLNIVSVSLSGASAVDFEIFSEGCVGRKLRVSESCAIEVIFQPLTGGNGKSAGLVMVDNSVGSPHTASLSGTGVLCGDGRLEAAEQCDDGNTVTETCFYGEKACTVCTHVCLEHPGSVSYCGDGHIDGLFGEQCDDANSINADGCTNTCFTDGDRDEVPDVADNCAAVANVDQEDNDQDGPGDACDADDDDDLINDDHDNCSLVANPDQMDTDIDGRGDACQSDDDGDGAADAEDNCPKTKNALQEDADGDGAGDVCDSDDDNDGWTDASDNCSFAANGNQADQDHDGVGDVCDPQTCGNGQPEGVEACDDGNLQDGDGCNRLCQTERPIEPPAVPAPEESPPAASEDSPSPDSEDLKGSGDPEGSEPGVPSGTTRPPPLPDSESDSEPNSGQTDDGAASPDVPSSNRQVGGCSLIRG